MRTTISIPNTLFRAAERLARKIGVSRSGLYSAAVAAYVAKHDASQITEQLNRVYRSESLARSQW
jgi:metal-responsive CopG/Arc/MetJ family transcriptional regulator